MTTSTTLDRAERPLQAQQYSESGTTSLVRATPFDFGSGHVNPRAALDPRLIFDAEAEILQNLLEHIQTSDFHFPPNAISPLPPKIRLLLVKIKLYSTLHNQTSIKETKNGPQYTITEYYTRVFPKLPKGQIVPPSGPSIRSPPLPEFPEPPKGPPSV
ncbi:Subtilisin-like protease [Abeliophyllum distichum]|uniref:Subtilisin-like protease n=1 Tax=Abeliophyllum distichum TaxID=126358 RepID=A0ABD1RSL4_9LAMI